MNQRLFFPSLVYQKDFVIKARQQEVDCKKNIKPSWTRKVKLYKINWSNVELRKKIRHIKWNKKYWPNVEIPYINSLPTKLDEEVLDYVYALDVGYLNEIRRCSEQGLIEWNTPRPFDTIIRDMCLDVPQAYIQVAFRLLSDCIFNEETGYWSKGDRRESACLMLYKFWCHQTGQGLLSGKKHSNWDCEYANKKKWTEEVGKTRSRVEEASKTRKRVEIINNLLTTHQKDMLDARPEIPGMYDSEKKN